MEYFLQSCIATFALIIVIYIYPASVGDDRLEKKKNLHLMTQ